MFGIGVSGLGCRVLSTGLLGLGMRFVYGALGFCV